MASVVKELEIKGCAAKESSRKLASLSSEVKGRVLCEIAVALVARQKEIITANRHDCETAETAGMGTAMLDRLMLNAARLEGIAHDVRSVASLPDPIGETLEMRTMPNGMQIGRKRVPLGVIGSIFESRPNVTVDIASLCLKSGNAVILRGGKEAIHSNITLGKVLQETAYSSGIPEGAIQLVESIDRSAIVHMLKMKGIIDLIIPRGGASLINFVVENAMMPVIAGGIGVCHTYIDKAADFTKAVAIAYNAKVQRPTVCNALDTLLVHRDIVASFLPLIAQEWGKAGVEMHCDGSALEILGDASYVKALAATEDDWGKEFLALIAAVKVVNSLDEALDHVYKYSSGHSEAIVTEDYSAAMRFLNEVDAACVYANASTRFTDGAQFGLGAEVGISTQKFHARGPLGLKELTSYKWIVFGDGHVRP